MRAAWAVMMKDLLLLVREPQGLLFTVGFPLVFGVFFGAIYSSSANGESRTRAALVALDGGPEAAALIAELRTHESFAFYDASSEAAAETMVRRGQVAAGVVVRDGFGASIGALTLEGGSRPAAVRLIVDPSNRAAAAMTEGVLAAAVARRRGAALAERLGVPHELRAASAAGAAGLLERREVAVGSGRPRNAYEMTFAQSMVWAMMGCAAAFAVSLVRERETGTLVRLRLAPGGAWWGLLGKALACFVVSALVASGFAMLGVVAFGVTVESAPMLIAAVAAGSLCFAGVMMLLAVLARGQGSPGQLAWGVLLVLAIAGGGMLPLAFMPEWLARISVASPVRWSILSVEGAVWRSFDWSEAAGPLALLLTAGVAGFVLGGALLARDRSTDC